MQFSKFPHALLDVSCADVFLNKFSDCYIEKEELQPLCHVSPESDQERELLKAFSSHTQCVMALRAWKRNCKDKANYRFVLHVWLP